MNISERIQSLRKSKGISQEELANEVGVSRQAVSKWESGQSVPDLEKVIILSEVFNVTTDYILKGIEQNKNDNVIISKIFYIGSTFMMTIGLLSAFGSWYEKQSMGDIAGGMLIQAVGVAGYFIGAVFSSEKANFAIKFINTCIVLFMPASILAALVFHHIIAPYPTDILHAKNFIIVYAIAIFTTFFILRRNKLK